LSNYAILRFMKTQTSFRPYNPDQLLLLPPDMTHWLPEDHLVYFIRDVVEQMDLSVIYVSYDGSQGGYPAYHPEMMVGLLIYGYRVGVASSRKIEEASAHGVGLRRSRAHPAWSFRDPNTYAFEPIFAVHYNKEAARAMGVPLQYDVGLQRHCWGVHLLINWMGDEGWLRKSYTEYRRFNYYGDVVWVKGKVTKKYVDEEGDYCVDIERHAINQRGEDIMPSRATVALPSREKRVSPLDRRLT
jgi:hypothetical protein